MGGARVSEGAHTCGVFVRGAHQSIVHTKLSREALLCKGCKTKGKGKGKGQGSRKGKDKGKHKERGPRDQQEKNGAPRQRAPYFNGLAGTSSRDSKASKIGFYCTKFTCLCFPCCKFFFELLYIHLSPNWFSLGCFIQGRVDQNYLCPKFHVCLVVYISI